MQTESKEQPKLATCTRRTAEVFTFKLDYDYAVFVVDIRNEYYALLIESSFGGFSFAWSHPGNCFYGFLAQLDRGYLTSKMVGDDKVPDWEKTRAAIRDELLQRRRAGDISKEEAREEWALLESGFEHEGDFWNWASDTTEFKNDSNHEFISLTHGPRGREFLGLHQRFWPSFAAEMLKLAEENRVAAAAKTTEAAS